MVSFRKLLLVLAVIGITAGIASAANCNITVPTVPIVRAEGLTELVGTIHVSCTSVNASAIDFKLTSSTAAAFTNSLTEDPTKVSSPATTATITPAGGTAIAGTLNSASELDFADVPLTGGAVEADIANVRVNANGLGLTGGSITMSLTGGGVQGGVAIAVSTAPSSFSVAQSQAGLSFKVGKVGASLQCGGTPTPGQLVFTPGFKGAFRAPSTTNAVVLPEPQDGDMPSAGVQLVAIFSNIPANAVLTVPNTIQSASGNVATLVSPKPDSGATTAITVSGTTQTVAWQITSIHDITTSGEPFDTSKGTGVTIASTDGKIIGLGTVTVRGNLGPISTTTGPVQTNSKTEFTPRFVDTNGTASNVLTVGPCATTLLFPYVTTGDGFETGVAISNTTLDVKTSAGTYIFGQGYTDQTKTLAPQSGSCTLNFFPSASGATVPAAQTTVSIPAGSQSVFLVSSGSVQGDTGITGVGTGFSGYILAQCNFTNAEGFAFGTSGVGGFGYTAADVTVNKTAPVQ